MLLIKQTGMHESIDRQCQSATARKVDTNSCLDKYDMVLVSDAAFGIEVHYSILAIAAREDEKVFTEATRQRVPADAAVDLVVTPQGPTPCHCLRQP
jgi:hypothetical protein